MGRYWPAEQRNSGPSPSRHRLPLTLRIGTVARLAFIDHGPPESNEPEWFRELHKVKSHDYPGQLYNLKTDPTQSIDLYGKHPEKVQELKALLVSALQ